MSCPTCRRPTGEAEPRFRPFCSERCRLVDLSRWLDGSYAIPGEPASDEDLAADLLPEDAESSSPRKRAGSKSS